jgi:PadR family transcriptional regulator AphA
MLMGRMSLRHAVLGLLAVEPATGYDLAQRFAKSMANAWHAGHSQIYPELARLQQLGMVVVVGEGARRSRTYAVTSAGREELRRWMTETEPTRTQRSETGVRWFLLAVLEPEDRRRVLEKELAFMAAEADRLQAIADALDAMPGTHPFRSTVDLGLRVNAVMAEWLREQLAPPPLR